MTVSTTLWNISLDTTSETSLQRQLHKHIRDAVLSGSLTAGTKLPASRKLAAELGVARVTVTEAYDQLVAEGYLEATRGAGTFVAAFMPDTLVALSAVPEATSAPPTKPSKAPLHSGMPALDQFPADKWARVAGRTARRLNTRLMYHSDPMGYLPLRQAIVDYLGQSRNVSCQPEQLMIVSGLQQGLYLVASSALGPEDAVIMEDPGYDGMLSAARASGRRVQFTGVDEDGAIPPDKKDDAPAGLLVTSPSRQYPLGLTMPYGRRLELLAWAEKSDSLILEDDYDSEFRYAGRPLNSLQGIDGGGRVIYGGTFSKSLFPALRLGYLALPEHLVDPVCRLRVAIDSFPSIANQQVLHAFMESGEFTRHLRRLRKIHGYRKAVFEASAHRHLAQWLDFQASDAGLHLLAWCRAALLASNLKDEKLAGMAQACGIGAVPVSRCYQQSKPQQGLLIGFANLVETEIDSALQRLAQMVHQETGFSS